MTSHINATTHVKENNKNKGFTTVFWFSMLRLAVVLLVTAVVSLGAYFAVMNIGRNGNHPAAVDVIVKDKQFNAEAIKAGVKSSVWNYPVKIVIYLGPIPKPSSSDEDTYTDQAYENFYSQYPQ